MIRTSHVFCAILVVLAVSPILRAAEPSFRLLDPNRYPGFGEKYSRLGIVSGNGEHVLGLVNGREGVWNLTTDAFDFLEPNANSPFTAYDISEDGTAILADTRDDDGTFQSAVWTLDGPVVTLEPLQPGKTVHGISLVAGGGAVGFAVTDELPAVATLWNESGDVENLNELSGIDALATAFAASANGKIIAGRVDGVTGFWDEDRQYESLGALPGDNFSFPVSISADGGTILGNSEKIGAAGMYAPFRWTAEEGMVSLARFGDSTSTQVRDMSSDGRIIVASTNTGLALINAGSGWRDLREVLELRYGLADSLVTGNSRTRFRFHRMARRLWVRPPSEKEGT